MKTKLYIYSQSNHLLFRTAIGREQKQFIKIAFAVHLSAVISAERYRSDSGALKSAVPHQKPYILVQFLIISFAYAKLICLKPPPSVAEWNCKNKIEQSAAQSCSRTFELRVLPFGKTSGVKLLNLLNSLTNRTFENRRSRYKEPSKNKAEAYRVYVEDTFLPCDAVIARIFSKDDVYGINYGFGLDAPKETEQANPQDLFAYRRNYTWNERNLLTKSSDRNFTVHYRYGEDGQRALKYTDEGRSETLYFNNFFTIHIPTQDQNNPQGLRVHKHIFVGNSRLVTAMTHTDNSGDNEEQKVKRYYYHGDHLGSAQFVTDWHGRQYEHIEYTPYGELWIEEVAAGLDKLPFRFTGKELDEETGLYYYGARYLDPKYSRWLSGDPALGEYIPQAPVNDEAKKHNENLPGMGGVFNVVNLHVYHYAGNNPIKYTDPTGMWVFSIGLFGSAGAGVGGSISGGISIGYSKEKGITIGIFSSKSIGAEFVPNASAGVSVSVDISSPGVESGVTQTMTIGGSSEFGIAVGGDITLDLDTEELSVAFGASKAKGTGGNTGTSAKFGVGASVSGGEVHVRYNSTQTKATSLKAVTDSVSNKIKQVIDNYLIEPMVESFRMMHQ